jgi:hypothetical protein
MRNWIIVAVSLVVALAAVAALVPPELMAAPHAAALPRLTALLPAVVVTALAVYALCAILLGSGGLIGEALRLRRQIERNPAHHWPDWTVVFAASPLRRLVPPPAPVQPRPAPADGTVVLLGQFRSRDARREIARLFYIGAARSHFFSAWVLLAAAVVLGAAQLAGPLPHLRWTIPAVPAALAAGGLVLLAILARIAVDVAAEPLIEAIARLPSETVEAGLLRRTAELFETAEAAGAEPVAAMPVAMPQIPERLGELLEESHRALSEAVERLSAATSGLAATTTSSVEALEAVFRGAEPHPQAAAPDASTIAAMAELRVAVSDLTAVLEGVRPGPGPGAVQRVPAEPGPARGEREPGLAHELRQLLQDIETAP